MMNEKFDVNIVLNHMNTPDETDSMIMYATRNKKHKKSLKERSRELLEAGEGMMPW